MKRLLQVMVYAAPLALLGGCAGNAQKVDAGSEAATIDMDTPLKGGSATLTVFGMSCPLCANNVDKALLDVPGVTGVSVDMSTGRAVVALDAKTPPTRRMLERAVHNSGFTLKSVEVP